MNTLKKDAIMIRFEDDTVRKCSSAIMIPERAMTEAGYIKTMTTNANAHSKHEFHAMAQMALFQFKDGELDIAHNKIMIIDGKPKALEEKNAENLLIIHDKKLAER